MTETNPFPWLGPPAAAWWSTAEDGGAVYTARWPAPKADPPSMDGAFRGVLAQCESGVGAPAAFTSVVLEVKPLTFGLIADEYTRRVMESFGLPPHLVGGPPDDADTPTVVE